MPLPSTTAPRPRLHTHAALPLWRRLHRFADTAVPAVVTVWLGLLTDFRQGMAVDMVREALQTHRLLGMESLAQEVWAAAVDRPARRQVPALLTPLLEDAADASMLDLAQAHTGRSVAYEPDLPATVTTLALYVGQQLRLIGGTTRRALRETVRQDPQAVTPVETLARQLHLVAGLTPRQATGLLAAEARLLGTGAALAGITATLDEAALRGRALRAQAIAATQTMATVNMGYHAALTQAVQRGVVSSSLRRYWIVLAGACPVCQAIADRYLEGAAVDEPFITDDGEVLMPPIHAH